MSGTIKATPPISYNSLDSNKFPWAFPQYQMSFIPEQKFSDETSWREAMLQTYDVTFMLSFLYYLYIQSKINKIIYVCLRFQLVSWFVFSLTTLSLTKSKLAHTYNIPQARR